MLGPSLRMQKKIEYPPGGHYRPTGETPFNGVMSLTKILSQDAHPLGIQHKHKFGTLQGKSICRKMTGCNSNQDEIQSTRNINTKFGLNRPNHWQDIRRNKTSMVFVRGHNSILNAVNIAYCFLNKGLI